MGTLSVPNSFTASTTILSAAVNSNFSAITSWAAGGIQQDNFGTMSGAIAWTIASNVLALSGTTSSTAGLISYSSTGVLASGNSLLKLTNSVAQTTGIGALDLRFTHASSTIPIVVLTNAGSGKFIECAATSGGSSLFSVSSAGVINSASTTPLRWSATGGIILSGTVANDAGYVTLQPNINRASDTTGGAFITINASNGTGSGNPASDGAVDYYAYGQGSGTYANAHTFFSRSGSGTTGERLRISASGVKIGGGVTLSNSSGYLVSDGYRFFPGETSRASLTAGDIAVEDNGRTLGVKTTGGGSTFPIVVSAVPSTHGLLIVQGLLPASGNSATTGEGFSYTHTNGTGVYSFTYTQAFANSPSVQVTPSEANQLLVGMSVNGNSSGVTVSFRNAAGAVTDYPFSILAIGQRGA